MKRGLFSVNRDAAWTGWDLDCRGIVRTKSDYRARVRRHVKRRHNRVSQREVEMQLMDRTSEDAVHTKY